MPMPEPLSLLLAPAPSAICERVDDSAVLLHADTGDYFELDPVALFVWQNLDGQRDGHALADAVAAHFRVSIETASADLAPFLKQLLEARLVAAPK
jgi:hypothetical protein